MPNAIFAAPVLSENAARMIAAAARLEGVRLGDHARGVLRQNRRGKDRIRHETTV